MTGSLQAPRIAVIGLGLMGEAIARRLARTAYPVRGYDIDADRLAAAAAGGVVPEMSIGAACADADVILTSLPSDEALESACAALANTQHAGSRVLCELSTLSVETKRRARALLDSHHIEMLDCPLSGTGAQAQTGDLVAYASGGLPAYQRVVPVLLAFCRQAPFCGEFGTGMRVKLIANLLVAIHNVAAAEALAVGKACGLDLPLLHRLLCAGAGTSRMLEVRGPLMIEERFEPATMKLGIWRKDLRLIEELLASSSARAPLFEASLPVYRAAVDAGFLSSDTAIVFRILEQWASYATDEPLAKHPESSID